MTGPGGKWYQRIVSDLRDASSADYARENNLRLACVLGERGVSFGTPRGYTLGRGTSSCQSVLRGADYGYRD
jgi:hypothetical protein